MRWGASSKKVKRKRGEKWKESNGPGGAFGSDENKATQKLKIDATYHDAKRDVANVKALGALENAMLLAIIKGVGIARAAELSHKERG